MARSPALMEISLAGPTVAQTLRARCGEIVGSEESINAIMVRDYADGYWQNDSAAFVARLEDGGFLDVPLAESEHFGDWSGDVLTSYLPWWQTELLRSGFEGDVIAEDMETSFRESRYKVLQWALGYSSNYEPEEIEPIEGHAVSLVLGRDPEAITDPEEFRWLLVDVLHRKEFSGERVWQCVDGYGHLVTQAALRKKRSSLVLAVLKEFEEDPDARCEWLAFAVCIAASLDWCGIGRELLENHDPSLRSLLQYVTSDRFAESGFDRTGEMHACLRVWKIGAKELLSKI